MSPRTRSTLLSFLEQQLGGADLPPSWSVPLPADGGEGTSRRQEHEGWACATHRDDASDGTISIRDLHLAATLHLTQMLRKVILQLGDLDPLHGHM